MELTISGVDYAPHDLYEQTPFVVDLIRELPGDDRPDYWLAELRSPIRWLHENHDRRITHLILAARWEGTRIEPGVKGLPVGIAYVIDPSLLGDSRLDFAKCSYVAIGVSHDTGAGTPVERTAGVLAGTIGRFFGRGNQ
jgi:hypothetical protein